MALHPFLEPAKEAAVGEVKGAPTAPTTDELQMLLTQHAAVINQQSAVIQQQAATILALQNAIPDQIANALTSYNTTFVAPLVQQVGSTSTGLAALTTTVGTKAAAADLTALVATVGSKAASADLTALQSIVSTHTTDIASNATALAGKALATDVTALTTLVGTKAAQADLTSLSTTVASKAASTAVAVLAGVVDTKASTADLSALNITVAGKALASDLATTNSNVAANTSAIALRATTASVTALQATVTQNTTDIATKATTAALTTQAGRIDSLLNTTVPALQADTALRLLKTGDVATGSIMVPNATAAAAAPRLDQTYGGLNAPIRFATSVGTTAVAMQPGPLTDPTPQGRKAKPYLVVLTMRTAPTIGATITVGTTAGGAEVFTKTYTLALLPGLNAVLAPMQPIFIELPAGTTLYAKATAGTWDVEVLSYYKS